MYEICLIRSLENKRKYLFSLNQLMYLLIGVLPSLNCSLRGNGCENADHLLTSTAFDHSKTDESQNEKGSLGYTDQGATKWLKSQEGELASMLSKCNHVILNT